MTLRYRGQAIAHVCDAMMKPTSDPTGTLDLRKRFKFQTDTRWRRFARLVRDTVKTQDMLGLGQIEATALSLSFANLPTDARLRSFQSFVDDTMDRVVLEGDAAYLDPMVEKSYTRAVTQAQALAKTTVIPPDKANAIGILQHLALTELQGIIEATSQQLVRAATNAIIEHNTKDETARAMAAIIEKIGVTRSRAMVSFLVVKAHSTGMLDTFEFAGVKRVGLVPESRPGRKSLGDAKKKDEPVAPAQARRGTSPSTIGRIAASEKVVENAFGNEMVEVLTAGDDLVCPECEEIAADGPYDIDEARSLIPAHPECRCTFVPEGSELFGTLEG